ncbi:MAG TPA: acetyl-CoA carboxylase biotin carboxyl carrier protein [Thermomicrobiales bacterium]|nr:acetyl-CoA carboxylase biotin carboxyl carrier protein [Thermomicrobiales bacterium]
MVSRPDELRTEQTAAQHTSDLADLPSLVAEIVETMRKGNLKSLEVSRGDFHLSIKSFGREAAPRVASANQSDGNVAAAHDDSVAEASPSVHTITSPMIGTFYVAPAPGEPPFVQPGDVIEQDQVIGIVEAMKIMNEIVADRGGKVIEIVAENGQTVEYGSPLVRLALDD